MGTASTNHENAVDQGFFDPSYQKCLHLNSAADDQKNKNEKEGRGGGSGGGRGRGGRDNRGRTVDGWYDMGKKKRSWAHGRTM